MRLAIDEDKKRKIIIEKVRKELIEVLGKQDKVVKLEGFSTEELNELLFNYIEEGATKKKIFALPNAVLQKIDMSNVSFDDFYASNIDFGQFTGVRIDPSKLYNKKCLYTSFAGVTFLNGFRSGYIAGCNFTGSKNAVIGDRIKTRLNRVDSVIGNDVLLGENNVFKDVTFESPITKGNIVRTDFTGSNDAVIELGPDKISSVVECCLKDATLTGTFAGCRITGAEFAGAKAEDGGKVKIDPNKLADTNHKGVILKDLEGCNFDGVEFTADFCPINRFSIRKTIFKGSEGAVLYPEAVFEKDYSFAQLSGVKFAPGSLITYSRLKGTNFTGSEGAIISGPQNSIQIANLTDAAITFNNPEEILSTPGIQSAGYENRAFSEVFSERLAVEFEEPAKVYIKRINDSVANANK